jgi:hypothetical protein
METCLIAGADLRTLTAAATRLLSILPPDDPEAQRIANSIGRSLEAQEAARERNNRRD